VTKQRDQPSIILGVQVFNPSLGFGVGDLFKVTLGRRKIGMLQDYLADNLDGNAGSGGPGGGVAAEIVWPEGTTDHLSGLGTYDPGCLIENRKNPILAGHTSLGGIFPDA
jgi:hypothetical protein